MHLRRSPHRFAKPTGFSLVELMISIVVGLVVVAGVISVFASAVKSHTDNLRMTRLNQELRTTMTLMTRELRRAGFWGGNKQHYADPPPSFDARGAMNTVGVFAGELLPVAANPFRVIAITGGNCITFSHDDDNDGVLDVDAVDPIESRGFQLDVVNRTVDSGANAACGGGGWTAITDPDAVAITGLRFTGTTQQLDIDGVRAGGGAVPCRLTIPPECAPGDNSITPNPQTVPVNEIKITLTGQLAGDASVTRTLQETVRVYNGVGL